MESVFLGVFTQWVDEWGAFAKSGKMRVRSNLILLETLR